MLPAWRRRRTIFISSRDAWMSGRSCVRLLPGDSVAGGDAANALDQARGLLEELGSQRLTQLTDLVDGSLAELPPPGSSGAALSGDLQGGLFVRVAPVCGVLI